MWPSLSSFAANLVEKEWVDGIVSVNDPISLAGDEACQLSAGGPRGAFIPPFVKKAMGGPGGEPEEGPLSSKTLEMLAGAVPSTPALQPRHPAFPCQRG